VIPAYRAEATLARTLESVLAEDTGAVARVIVVCSPSADREQVAVAARRQGVVVVESERRLSAGAARNLGRAHAGDAELLLFVDADCALDAGTVARLCDALADGRAAAVAASVANASSGAVAGVRHLLEFKDSEPGVPQRPDWMAPTATMLCRADAFDTVGGFPDMWPGEDLVFCWRLARAGLRVSRVSDATTRHLHPPGASALVRHQYRLGRTSARARLMTDMPGAAWARYPPLAALLLPARLGRAAIWLLRHRARSVPVSILLLPLYLAGLSAWTLGFVAEAAATGGGRG
jgi:GT2 family glycosyltransferase